MMILTVYSWVVVVLLGIRTSYTDLRFGKIRNKELLWGLVAALGFFIGTLAVGLPEGLGIAPEYVIATLWNIFVGILVAYWFWRLHIWSAGDGKLFVVFLAMIPLSWYEHGYISIFPGFVLLLNSIVPLVGFLLLRLVYSLFRKQRWKMYLGGFQTVSLSLIVKEVLQFIALFLLGRVLVGVVFTPLRALLLNWMPWFGLFFPPLHDQNTAIVLALFVFMSLRKWMKASPLRSRILTGIALATVIVEVSIGWKSWDDFWNMTLGMLLTLAFVLVVFRVFMSSLVHFVRVEAVLVPNLLEGMVLTPRSFSILKEKDGEVFAEIEQYAEGLSAEQVVYIQEWYRRNAENSQPNESLEVYMTSAFAPFLFLGAVITGILRQGIL